MRPIEHFPRDPQEAAALLPVFAGYNKIQGMLLCRALDLPTLPAIVINPAQVSAEIALSAARTIDPSRYLVRHDRAPETGSYPQGGYIVRSDEIEAELEWYRQQSRLIVLLSPADPLDNLYSASALLTSDNMLSIEVVGPGFDAGDLNRGFISPLESYRFLLDDSGRTRFIGSSQLDAESYSVMKSLRIRKIALKYILKKRLFNLNELDENQAIATLRSSPRTAQIQFRHLLSDEGYVKAPRKFLAELERFASVMHRDANSRVAGEKMLAFSASQIDNSETTVVWDIVYPQRKYALN